MELQSVYLEGAYLSDPVHSNVGFAIKAAGLAGFRSAFGAFDARLEDGVLSGSGELDSLQIREPHLKATLLSSQFFDAASHPSVTFTSSALRVDEAGGLELDGELTMHGETRPVTARGELATGQDPSGGERVAFDLKAQIDRREFGIDWQQKLPNGADAVGWNVALEVQLQLVKQD
ncbi:YceI family protein [Solirubrobacter phytolaccae]|uniref:YceI family protein n=1 Tax=Solirubrobacter phytolaccae TaxID=1404360 RepID=A0A9X3SA92_9ACTN|nr:YceI family protein [Solirubrobacter phytolaccae]MDA0183408.1 YceI family protein [Solirubrobacter phytolaccae]